MAAIILMATIGGGLIGGAYFLALGYLPAQGALETRVAAVPGAAQA
jgi:hypothetical protein